MEAWNKFSLANPGALAWFVAVAGILPGPSTAAELQRFIFRDALMGVEFRIACYATDRSPAKRAADLAFARIRLLDERLSDYREDSELSRLTQEGSVAYDTGQPVSPDLWSILVAAQAMSEDSGGAFDVTVGPLTRLWRRARRRQELPSQDRLAEARAAVGHAHLVLRPSRHVVLKHQPMRLDLGGIAKGFAADAAIEVLRREGITRALVDAGGDLSISGPPPRMPGWRVAVAPLGAEADPLAVLKLADCGVATSGDTSRLTEIDGRRYSHIIDPRSGTPRVETWGVTVIADNGMSADALASACCVLGPAAGAPLCQRRASAAAFARLADNGEVAVEFSDHPQFPSFR